MRWAICSSPLLDVHATQTRGRWPSIQWFQELWDSAQIRPEDLAELRIGDDPQVPIGRYFERLVGAFFELHPDYQVVAKNLVIVHMGRTIGECDLVIQHRTNQSYYQIELACKYYLGTQHSGDWADWKGRNVRDTLQTKWEKLQQQLQLFEHPAGKAWLQSLAIPKIETVCFLKGYVFVPWSELQRAKLPRWHHSHQHVGWYTHLHEWSAKDSTIRQWLILPKAWWLVFPDIDFALLEKQLLDGEMLYEQLHAMFKTKRHRGWLIAQVMEKDGKAYELSRGMVVDRTWPKP